MEKDSNTAIQEEETSYELFFAHNDFPNTGFSFPCDRDGKILTDRLNPRDAQNAKRCQSGKMPEHGSGAVRPVNGRNGF